MWHGVKIWDPPANLTITADSKTLILFTAIYGSSGWNGELLQLFMYSASRVGPNVHFVVFGFPGPPKWMVIPDRITIMKVGWNELVDKAESALQANLSGLRHMAVQAETYGTQKVNDLKPLLPLFYPDMVKGYDHFGWCDNDMVYGRGIASIASGLGDADWYSPIYDEDEYAGPRRTWGPLTIGGPDSYFNKIVPRFKPGGVEREGILHVLQSKLHYVFDEYGFADAPEEIKADLDKGGVSASSRKHLSMTGVIARIEADPAVSFRGELTPFRGAADRRCRCTAARGYHFDKVLCDRLTAIGAPLDPAPYCGYCRIDMSEDIIALYDRQGRELDWMHFQWSKKTALFLASIRSATLSFPAVKSLLSSWTTGLLQPWLGCYHEEAMNFLNKTTPEDPTHNIDMCIVSCGVAGQELAIVTGYYGDGGGFQCLCGKDRDELPLHYREPCRTPNPFRRPRELYHTPQFEVFSTGIHLYIPLTSSHTETGAHKGERGTKGGNQVGGQQGGKGTKRGTIIKRME